ncbi:hypothetical protein LCGC14_1440500 [marine sediment metagenome]|uniref:J domain-containing protein n=1 Tax=marine sediment metagenome TaxID=412755 RepID=A0A0F9JLF5_9ZZZZ
MNPYEVLGLPVTATKKQELAAYRTKAKQYHPDINTTADAEPMMKRINAAYDMIMKGYQTRPMPIVPPTRGGVWVNVTVPGFGTIFTNVINARVDSNIGDFTIHF